MKSFNLVRGLRAHLRNDPLHDSLLAPQSASARRPPRAPGHRRSRARWTLARGFGSCAPGFGTPRTSRTREELTDRQITELGKSVEDRRGPRHCNRGRSRGLRRKTQKTHWSSSNRVREGPLGRTIREPGDRPVRARALSEGAPRIERCGDAVLRESLTLHETSSSLAPLEPAEPAKRVGVIREKERHVPTS